MAAVWFPCGTAYEVPEDGFGLPPPRSGRNGLFMAAPSRASAAAADAGPRRRLGDLAVERGLVSREHVELCVKYQNALRSDPSAESKRLGEILVGKRLLKPCELVALLQEQQGSGTDLPPRPLKLVARPEPDSDPRGRAASRRALPRRPIPRWARYLALIPILALGGVAVGRLWPGPAVQRTLETYLRGRSEAAAERADYLAVRDLGIEVYDFRVEAVLPSVEHDYTSDIRACLGGRGLATWGEFPRAAVLSATQRRVLEFILPSLPLALKPHPIENLVVTVQPVRVSMFYRQAGERFFRHERCLFSVVRVDSPRWSFGWRVAAYESLEPPSS